MWFHCLIISTIFPFFIQICVRDDEYVKRTLWTRCPVNTDQVENWYKFNKNQVRMLNVHIVRYAAMFYSPYLNANLHEFQHTLFMLECQLIYSSIYALTNNSIYNNAYSTAPIQMNPTAHQSH